MKQTFLAAFMGGKKSTSTTSSKKEQGEKRKRKEEEETTPSSIKSEEVATISTIQKTSESSMTPKNNSGDTLTEIPSKSSSSTIIQEVKKRKLVVEDETDHHEEEEQIVAEENDQDVANYSSDEEEENEEEDEIEETGEETDASTTSSSFKASTSKKISKAPSFEYQSYDPIANATWKTGTSTPYLFLAKTLDQISKIGSSIKKTELLCNCFRSIIAVSPNDLLYAVYLSINKLAPAHLGIELGVGESLIQKALAEATGKSLKKIKELSAKEGDLGLVANAARSTQKTMFKPKSLTIKSVFDAFKFIATTEGKKSMNTKVEKIKLLLVSAVDVEPMFIIRSLQGKLRIGLGEETVLIALSHAVLLSKKSKKSVDENDLKFAKETLKSVYSEIPSYDDIIPAVLEHGFEKLPEICHLKPGFPVRPMLAKSAKGVQELFERFGDKEFTCEFKYDGERAQIHMLPDKTIKIYSRNMENHTAKYPDLIQLMPQVIKENVTSFIIDCEVVAYDPVEKKIKPFQVLSTRGRKNIQLNDIKVQVCLFAFDLLYLNGESYLKKTLKERRKALHENFTVTDDKFQFASSRDTTDPNDIQIFLDESIKGNCEGLMVKTLTEDATYEPSKRSFNWLKLKKDYIEGLGDSVDLVVIGGYKGKGKRTGVYGGFLLACYDPESDQYQSICKIGTGFSDEMLKQCTETMDRYIIPNPRPYYAWKESQRPDVWFDAKVVWEIKAADLTISPAHMAAVGLVDESKGIALRFPRFIRVREDKTPEQATTGEQIAELFNSQAVISQNKKQQATLKHL
ncbi:hypothetical protein FDP41_005143 [Naegleria fowleri]|uniref:DNA ligase n=1 Tax=Naegleria fowleri TaxID=5763 RepID=A0A6A5BLQ3_NAEFO|nr:uncharacterized protein FDP41_005143 [Naegleria fowleri]KAF0975816.1 hypothetical protein FDP41_005143 [Naegleria fowleri]